VKKIISLILLACSGLLLSPNQLNAKENTYFVVTAYYSPLPDQDYYITGNYEDELILN